MLLRVFFIAEDQKKGIAKENLTSENGHHILSGEQYLEIVYLQKKNEKRQKQNTNVLKKINFIHIAEMFNSFTLLKCLLSMLHWLRICARTLMSTNLLWQLLFNYFIIYLR